MMHRLFHMYLHPGDLENLWVGLIIAAMLFGVYIVLRITFKGGDR
jgi:hypothetical protein